MSSRRTMGLWDRASGDDAEDQPELVLPSRLRLINRVIDSLLGAAGIVVVTGEPGVGKTWLASRISGRLPTGWSSIRLDLSPATTPSILLRDLAEAIGAGGPGAVADRLCEAAGEGRCFLLIADEAQNADEAVIEQLRLLSNNLGRPDGLAGMLLIGQSPLIRRLAGPKHRAVQSRVSMHGHLRALDYLEAGAWVAQLASGWRPEAAELDGLHRETLGNPRHLRRLLNLRSDLPSGRATGSQAFAGEMVERPPIRLEEGLIEVGWPSTESDADQAQRHEQSPVARVDTIDDPYAELQALGEIERIGRQVAAAESAWRPVSRAPGIEEYAELMTTAAAKGTRVRVESNHDYAPFGQLFRSSEAEGGSGGGGQVEPDAA